MLQRVSLNRQFNNQSAQKGDRTTMFDDRQSNISMSSSMMQFGAVKGKTAAGHKNYLRNMLINRLIKKFPDQKSEQLRMVVEDQVNVFIASEYVTKESIRQLEQQVSRKLNPNTQAHHTQNSERKMTLEDDRQVVDGGPSTAVKKNKTYDLDMLNSAPGRYQPKNASTVKRSNISSKIKLVNTGDLPQLKSNGQFMQTSREAKAIIGASTKSVPRPNNNNQAITTDEAGRDLRK